MGKHSRYQLFIYLTLTIVMLNCCNQKQELANGVVHPKPENFVANIDGRKVGLFTLENRNGVRADITNYGGRIVSLLIPCKEGIFDDVVNGFHHINDYLNTSEVYYGAVIGRYANRIANARFSLDGKTYQLMANNGPNSLHGGPGGFHQVVWDAKQLDRQTLQLNYVSPHLEEGFPGNLDVKVTYMLSDDNALHIEYNASTDHTTVINLTNHAFFNLSGEGSSTINDHFIKIYAHHYTPVNEVLIPTGEIAPVENTPFDFRDFRRIGEFVDADHPQIQIGKGYDHNFVLMKTPGIQGAAELAASVYDPISGRKMDVYTSEPGMQFYGGNFLSGNVIGKRGEPYLFRSSFCLETQHFPDSPNQPHFPSVVLHPGQTYTSKTIYQFSLFSE